jgi:DNA-binding NtrC family response regulator
MSPFSEPGKALRLLCIDDELRILRALKALFRDCDVQLCSDPRQALEMARQFDPDVVLCDQRMPQLPGVDVLREMKAHCPRSMRILLTGYADLKAVLGSVNEGEVFQYVNKPWDNAALRALVHEAARIAREAPSLDAANIPEREAEVARGEVGVLVLEDDVSSQHRIREILAPHYQVRFANNTDRALQILEQHETGVVISETETMQGDLTGLLKALKLHHPHIATVILTERANAQTAMELINEGQVYRMLIKPVRMGSCRLSVDAAISRYWKLKRNPRAVARYALAQVPGFAQPRAHVSDSLMARIRSLPSRIVQVMRLGA